MTDDEIVEALEQQPGIYAQWALSAINAGFDPQSVWAEHLDAIGYVNRQGV